MNYTLVEMNYTLVRLVMTDDPRAVGHLWAVCKPPSCTEHVNILFCELSGVVTLVRYYDLILGPSDILT